MVLKVFLAVLILTILEGARAQFSNCDLKGTLTLIGQTAKVDHIASYGPCRVQIIAPVDSIIHTQCKLVLANSACTSTQFVVSRSGSLDLRDGVSHCTTASISVHSIGNEIVVAHLLSSGSFNCTFTVVALTDANCDCGWNVNTKIVGGTNTGVNEFVSHAGLVDGKTKEIFCGAIILKQNWAVTAAHCFDAFPNASSTALLVGDHDISVGTDTKWAAAYAVLSYIKHAYYNSDTNVNDIALVRTKDYIRFTPGVGPACLPYTFNGVSFVGLNLTVVGWGTTSFGGPVSNILQKAPLGVISNSVCSQSMANIDVTKICTFGNKVRDSCGKDSGGGLYWMAGRYYAIAIVNYGYYCASKDPSVNSRLDRYFGWIEEKVGGFFCNKK